MSQTQSMKRILIVALLVMAGSVLAACGSKPVPVPSPRPKPTDVTIAVAPDPTPTTAPTPVPTAVLLAPDDGCVECHTSDAMLQETAKEDVVVESLSEGEG